jgi:diguanylate cyclase
MPLHIAGGAFFLEFQAYQRSSRRRRNVMQIGLDEIWLDKLQQRTGFDRDRSRRLYRVMLVCAIGISYVIDTILYGAFAIAGTIEPWVVAAYGLGGLGHVVLFTTIHWYCNVEGRSDPQLVQWQMGYAIFVQIGGIAVEPKLAPLFIATTFLVFAFGSLRMELRQALVSWFFAFLAIGVVLAVPARPTLGIVDPTRLEMAIFCVAFALIALRTSLLAYYGNAMRMRLYKVNDALNRAKLDAERLAARDPLTGALTRRAILPLVERTVKRATRAGLRGCVVMIDIDWFKSVNDRFGHLVGDQVLKRVVERIRECSRDVDILGRYGGEEFLLLLQGVDETVAAQLVERTRRAISSMDWSALAPGLSVSVSCGVAGTRPNDTVDSLLARADRALYEAKRGGRDQMRVA